MDNDRLIRALEDGLTVKELIDELQTMDPKSKVVFAYNYGDYTRTQVAAVVRTVDADVEVAWSSYCDMPKIIEDDGGNCDNEDLHVADPDAMVVVLNLG